MHTRGGIFSMPTLNILHTVDIAPQTVVRGKEQRTRSSLALALDNPLLDMIIVNIGAASFEFSN